MPSLIFERQNASQQVNNFFPSFFPKSDVWCIEIWLIVEVTFRICLLIQNLLISIFERWSTNTHRSPSKKNFRKCCEDFRKTPKMCSLRARPRGYWSKAACSFLIAESASGYSTQKKCVSWNKINTCLGRRSFEDNYQPRSGAANLRHLNTNYFFLPGQVPIE